MKARITPALAVNAVEVRDAMEYLSVEGMREQ